MVIEDVRAENCRAYPDEKGIETVYNKKDCRRIRVIAEPIPMKRELKPVEFPQVTVPLSVIAEPIPMKRELKLRGILNVPHDFLHCRAYPDEKGIETSDVLLPVLLGKLIAEPIPMKRELKLAKLPAMSFDPEILQSLSR